jgi:hypothetical protein
MVNFQLQISKVVRWFDVPLTCALRLEKRRASGLSVIL